MSSVDTSSASNTPAGNGAGPCSTAPLVSAFVSECNARSIAVPPSVADALAACSSTGIFELTDCMLGENAVACVISALAACHRTSGSNAAAFALAHGADNEDGNGSGGCVPPLKRVAIRNAYMGDKGVSLLLRHLVKYEAHNLEALELPGNSIGGADVVGDIATAVAVFRELRTLSLDWNKCGGASASAAVSSSGSQVASGVAAASSRYASVSRGASPASVASAPADADAAFASATDGASRLPPSDALHRLLKAVAQHPRLERVSVQNNLLGRGCVEDVCAIIAATPTSALKHLDISWNGLGESAGTRIANAVTRASTAPAPSSSSSSSSNNQLLQLSFEGNSFARRDAEQIDKVLRQGRAAAQRDAEMRHRLEELQLAALQAQSSKAESSAKLAAKDMLLDAAQKEAAQAKAERDASERAMKAAQEQLHRERVEFQQRVQQIQQDATGAVEQASQRLRDALAEADRVSTQCRVQRSEMEAELSGARDAKYAAERESATAVATAQAARTAMERVQAEHGVVARGLTESRHRIAELEMLLKVRDDELERLRSSGHAHEADVESLKGQLRAAQERGEQLKLQVRDWEERHAELAKRHADEVRGAVARSEGELHDALAAEKRATRAALDDKAALERTLAEHKAEMAAMRRAFEASSGEAAAHGDKCRAQVTDAQLELEQLKSKLSLLEVESTRSESRATTAEERNRLLQKELHSSLDAHKQRIEELARDFERKLSEKETELQFRAGECRVLAEEAALLKAKNEALGAKMRQSQADLEKRVIKSLRSTMAEVRGGSGAAAAAGEDP